MASGTIFMQLSTGELLPGFGSTTAAPVWVSTKPIDFERPDVVKEIMGIVVEGGPMAALARTILEIGYHDRIKDDITWLEPILLATTDEMLWKRVPAARYIRLRITDLQPGPRWKITAIDFYGSMGGGRL